MRQGGSSSPIAREMSVSQQHRASHIASTSNPSREPLIAMTDNKIRIGVVGLSAKRGWAAEVHVPALARLPQFEIRGLAASSKESAKAAAEKFGVAFFTDDPADRHRRLLHIRCRSDN
jgi:hypothetical protein